MQRRDDVQVFIICCLRCCDLIVVQVTLDHNIHKTLRSPFMPTFCFPSLPVTVLLTCFLSKQETPKYRSWKKCLGNNRTHVSTKGMCRLQSKTICRYWYICSFDLSSDPTIKSFPCSLGVIPSHPHNIPSYHQEKSF